MSDTRLANSGCGSKHHKTCGCGCSAGNIFTKKRHHKWWKFKKHHGCNKNIFSR